MRVNKRRTFLLLKPVGSCKYDHLNLKEAYSKDTTSMEFCKYTTEKKFMYTIRVGFLQFF